MSSKNEQLILTSVKVHNKLFEEFKVAAILNKFNFQKMANRAMYMYLRDESFRNLIHNQNALVLSGSI